MSDTTHDPSGPALAVQSSPDAVGDSGQPAINGNGSRSAPEPDSIPAPDGSPFANLRARREKMAAASYLDIRVPGWGEDETENPRVSIYVRLRPIRPSELTAIRDRRRPSKNTQKTSKRAQSQDFVDLANADALVVACLEVWAKQGEPIIEAGGAATITDDDLDPAERLSMDPDGPHERHVRFDGKLADTLGMDSRPDGSAPSAVEIVRFLFLHDGHVQKAAERLLRHSDIMNDQDSEGFTGG